jgi:hypothetical protein
MKQTELTEQQKLFVSLVMGEEHFGDFQKAKEIAGYSPKTQVNDILDNDLVANEIVKQTTRFLALTAPKAAKGLVDTVDNPTAKGANNKIAASNSILDRVGIAKNLKVEAESKNPMAIVLLPDKNSD